MVSLLIKLQLGSHTSKTILGVPLLRRHLSINTSIEKPKKKKTVFLPKTSFVNHVKSTERSRLDQLLAAEGGINDLYNWQRQVNQKNRFEILDGPPYANGVAHTGHAINKILKDFIVKSRVLLGYNVCFRPGWDCHGLPIELKITKNVKNKSPVEIRALSREVAQEAKAKQMNAFKRWGVSADWDNPYLTMNDGYVAEQLRLFGKMIEQKLVYRTFKPVYWSPSSRTALAESELEYNDKHKSTAAYFRFKAIDISSDDLGLGAAPESKRSVVYLLTWTSTPWTLPLNDAIAVSSSNDYVVAQFDDELRNPVRELYVVAADLLPSIIASISRPITISAKLPGSQLVGKHYQSCWYNELALPIVSADYVTMGMGTGLVHTSYSHGFNDYTLGLARGEKIESFVDDDGRYVRQMGHELEGKDVLGEGQRAVLRILKKDIVHLEKYVHSYPYDWRTKKPVIIRSSAQWFVDVSRVGLKAAQSIRNIKIGGGDSDLSTSLSSLITTRPSWCISRQRVWGTPIPAIIDKTNGTAHTSLQLAERVAALIDENGCDVWWNCSVDDLLTPEVRSSLSIASDSPSDQYSKGNDIMDVWMDSGMAWHCARKDYDSCNTAEAVDVVLEGVDQFRGWFQSLLLTAVSMKDRPPYKRVLVHGFCVDEHNKKMSKSVGNVVDPEMITDGSLRQKALGADGLRLWVALCGAESAGESRIGNKVLEDVEKKIISLRNSFRFLLGGCDGYNGAVPTKLPVLDQFVLRQTFNFASRCRVNYESFRFRTVANELFQFTQGVLSTQYVNFVRDRLYCASLNSNDHIAAQFTLHRVGTLLAHSISPILPHLAAEFRQHQPFCDEKKILRVSIPCDESSLNLAFDPRLDDLMACIFKLRRIIAEKAGPKAELQKMGVDLVLSPRSRQLLGAIGQLGECCVNGELCELLGVSMVRCADGDSEEDQLALVESVGKHCERCRKMTRLDANQQHCRRCAEALSAPHFCG